MNKKCRGFILCSITILMVGICGCGINNLNYKQKTGGEVMLNERQLKILSEEGLPTEYDKLKLHQKRAIDKIEELYEYLDDKYEVEFEFIGYVPGGVPDVEHLVVYPSGGDRELDIVKVERSKSVITDNYAAVVMRPITNKVMSDYVGQTFDKKDFKVFTQKSSSTLDSLPIKVSDLSGNYNGFNYIYINSGNVKVSDFDKFINEFVDWIKKNKYYGSYTFYLLKNGMIKELTEDNYEKYYYGNEKTLRDVYCELNDNDEIMIEERGE